MIQNYIKREKRGKREDLNHLRDDSLSARRSLFYFIAMNARYILLFMITKYYYVCILFIIMIMCFVRGSVPLRALLIIETDLRARRVAYEVRSICVCA